MNAKFHKCTYYEDVLWVGYLRNEDGQACLYGASPQLGVIYCATGRGEFLRVQYVLAACPSRLEMLSWGPDRTFAELQVLFKASRTQFVAPAVRRDDFSETEGI